MKYKILISFLILISVFSFNFNINYVYAVEDNLNTDEIIYDIIEGINEEDFNEIIEYRIDERVQNKEIVIGKALLSIFEKYHKFMNIKISLIDDPNFDDFMKWGFLLISEEKIFSNM